MPDDPDPRSPRGLPAPPSVPLSQILDDLAQDPARDRIAIRDLMEALRLRAIGALLLIFAVPNALPAIPGTSGILGLPLIYLTFQLMIGQSPWLPKLITDRSMPRADFAALMGRVIPLLRRAEKLLRRRLTFVSRPIAERLIGALCLILSLVLALPIPLGNMLPAFAISVIALGILARDGLWVLAGSAIGLLSLLIVWGVVLALAKTAFFLVTNVLFT